MGILNWIGTLLRGAPSPALVACPSGPASQLGEPEVKDIKEKAMSTTGSGQAYHNNMVGPVMRAGDLAAAIIEAAKIDNPGKELFVDDKRAYIRIHMDQEMVLQRATIEEELGRPFKMNDLEVDLSSFAGQIESGDNSIRFYFMKKV
ncbi:MmoB/DmpM family protein [Dechloromonas sp. HYN0024]|uniref:MmoB/DmpM family protein n=1 Tax=Dechloromonas sp. HYN0024 TaxID=2231055 RepID=UPI001F08715D|nr:MmoB/DmpM family protein [Dechloromonas sp. HYN0024]